MGDFSRAKPGNPKWRGSELRCLFCHLQLYRRSGIARTNSAVSERCESRHRGKGKESYKQNGNHWFVSLQAVGKPVDRLCMTG